MRNHLIQLSFIATLLCNSFNTFAQINGSNLLEYQHGELPGDTAAFSSVYDRAVVKYKYKDFKANITLEQFHTPYEERNYTKLTQYSIQYKSKPLEISIGNFYESIGRGILLRSFEIPGAVIEDLSYRSRQYFNRDVLGVMAKYKLENFSAKVLYGKPLNYVFPPSQHDSLRRVDIIEAAYADYSFKKQTLGASALRLTNESGSSIFGMFTASGKLFPVLSYYTEFAKNVEEEIVDFSDNSSYAFYGSINLSFNSLGASIEYKDYNNFLLGAGINEPPALVKEHSYKVLNRSTHVLQPINERGYQLEAYYTFPNFSTLTLNNSIAINKLGKEYIFQEYFIEYDFSLNDAHDVKLFVDYAEDPFKLEEQRISAGSYLDWKVGKASTIKTEYEFQTFNRLDNQVQNHVAVIGYAYRSKFVFNIVAELSNDPFQIEQGNEFKTWFGTNLKYQVNSKNNVQLFAGQRRGGPACNAGVCYEVLDFTGVEIRLTSRF